MSCGQARAHYTHIYILLSVLIKRLYQSERAKHINCVSGSKNKTMKTNKTSHKSENVFVVDAAGAVAAAMAANDNFDNKNVHVF